MTIKTNSSYQLEWLMEMLKLFSAEAIQIPLKYREQVLEVKKLLRSDTSGLVHTIIDFMMEAGCVNYTAETKDKTLDKLLNSWLDTINEPMQGKVPVGVQALAKEYFRERWKGSSHLVLMTQWETVNNWSLPTRMWFLDGEDIVVTDGSKTGANAIGDERYELIVNEIEMTTIPLEINEKSHYFVQKPYDAWSTPTPIPFLIRRGVFRNMKFYDLLAGKGEHVVQKAIEYMTLIKKGSERLAGMNNADFVYSADDLKTVSEDFARFLAERRLAPANRTPHYTTNFDTDIEQIIPEYERALKQALYTPLERRILSGLGMVDIVESASSSRRESILNPKPLQAETQSGINDFAKLITDVIRQIVQRNRGVHPKKATSRVLIKTSSLKQFLSSEARTLIRSAYDRGLVSKETACELVADTDFEIEVERREKEKRDGLDEVMYPPVIQNQEQFADPNSDNPVPDDRSGPEAKNFDKADFEMAPWQKNEDLPASVKVLPPEAQSLWRRVANEALADGKSEESAFRIAWSVVKKSYKKNSDGEWIKKSE